MWRSNRIDSADWLESMAEEEALPETSENMKDDLCDAIQDHIGNLETRRKAAPSLNQELQYQGMIRELRRFKKALLSVHYEIEDALNELP